MDLISVIVPVYNTGQYLERCIQSILSQTYPNIEIIIIDDGSNDQETMDLCDKFAKEYSNVTCYHKQNGGSASARNYGLDKAKGKYIGFIDSDDWIEPNMYSQLYNDLNTYHVKLVLGEGIATDDNGKVIDKLIPIPKGVYNNSALMHLFLMGRYHSVCTNLYDSTLFNDIRLPENEVNEDYMVNYWIYKNVDRVYINEQHFYHYILRSDSNTTSPASLKFLAWIKHTKLIYDELRECVELRREAEFQYLYSNIVLANKALLTLGSMNSDDATELYSITALNLRHSRDMIRNNKFLTGKKRMMAISIAHSPTIYKWIILFVLKIKHLCQ